MYMRVIQPTARLYSSLAPSNNPRYTRNLLASRVPEDDHQANTPNRRLNELLCRFMLLGAITSCKSE